MRWLNRSLAAFAALAVLSCSSGQHVKAVAEPVATEIASNVPPPAPAGAPLPAPISEPEYAIASGGASTSLDWSPPFGAIVTTTVPSIGAAIAAPVSPTTALQIPATPLITLEQAAMAAATDSTPPDPEPKLQWNVWFEDHGSNMPATYRSVDATLKAKHTYTLYLDLAAIAYAMTETKPASEKIRELLSEAARNNLDSVQFTALILTDTSFRTPPRRNLTIDIPLEVIRRVLAWRDTDPPVNALEELKVDPRRDYVAAHKDFELTTRADARGATAIAISIWREGTPIDEIVISKCFEGTTACTAAPPYSSGIFSYGSATDAVAALHFIEIGADGETQAVLHRRDAPPAEEFLTWDIEPVNPSNPTSLADAVIASVKNSVSSRNTDLLRSAGGDVFNVLFPRGNSIEVPAHVRAMQNLLEDAASRGNSPRRPLYIRFISNSGQIQTMLPIALMTLFDTKTTHQAHHLGEYYTFETPAPLRRYDPAQQCIANWTVVMPKANASTGDLLTAVSGAVTVGSWRAARQVDDFCQIDPFRKWLQRLAPPVFCDSLESSSAPPDDNPHVTTTLLMTGHNDANQFRFDSAGGEILPATFLSRRFDPPSVAILNGCGTGYAHYADFIPVLNDQGFGSFIATWTQVNGDLAGDFVQALTNAVVTGRRIKLRDAFNSAVASMLSIQKYGGFALTYNLIGDGDVELCPPPATSQETP